MQRCVCFSLFVLFTLFTFRSFMPNDEGRKVSANEASYPLSDEDPIGESDTDTDLADSEDVDLQITQPLSLTLIAQLSQEQIQLQQLVFNSLPIEVITPPPQK